MGQCAAGCVCDASVDGLRHAVFLVNVGGTELVRHLRLAEVGGKVRFRAYELAGPSSSALRAAIAAGEGAAARELLPEALHAFVEREGLYRE